MGEKEFDREREGEGERKTESEEEIVYLVLFKWDSIRLLCTTPVLKILRHYTEMEGSTSVD